MNPNQQHQTKLNAATWSLLRQIAAHTGEKHYAVLARLLAQEWQRLTTAPASRKDTACIPGPVPHSSPGSS